jgi:hypothetical protein
MTRSLQWLVAFCLLASSLDSLAQSQEPCLLGRAAKTIQAALNSDVNSLVPAAPVLEFYSPHRQGKHLYLDGTGIAGGRLVAFSQGIGSLAREHRSRAFKSRFFATLALTFKYFSDTDIIANPADLCYSAESFHLFKKPDPQSNGNT